MWFVIWAEDAPNSLAARRATRPAHLERLKQLQADGRLLVAGPCPAIASSDPGEAGFTGSMVVAEFDSLAAAQAWADADPYIAAGVYHQVTVKPYIKALP
ncbi:YciI family protein [Pseudidiomarina gelatinasegens]|uniref:YciI family protein n=1 Tax=Pseudidiomarina gelatinasegens TaxID=2487740 RepID=A0A443Z6E3_9GAMM|nr:YciI family protein [Pseudidiomarina gelatinasegens]RWU12365.1 YciI family protein [Pseudidiomarina gelatinasegens]